MQEDGGTNSKNVVKIKMVIMVATADLINMACAGRELHETKLRFLIRLERVLGFDEDAACGIVEVEGRT